MVCGTPTSGSSSILACSSLVKNDPFVFVLVWILKYVLRVHFLIKQGAISH